MFREYPKAKFFRLATAKEQQKLKFRRKQALWSSGLPWEVSRPTFAATNCLRSGSAGWEVDDLPKKFLVLLLERLTRWTSATSLVCDHRPISVPDILTQSSFST